MVLVCLNFLKHTRLKIFRTIVCRDIVSSEDVLIKVENTIILNDK